MKVGIYSPYLDTLGGGERYVAMFAKAMLVAGYTVDLEWNDDSIVEKLSHRFNLDLKGVNVTKSINKGENYDITFWVSDGSIPLLHSRKNYLHFQFPFKKVNGKSLLNKMKMYRVSGIIVNSIFTKNIIDEEYGVSSIVLYPPINVSAFKPKRKENMILYVGRFSSLTQKKGQDILIQIFKKYYKKSLSSMKLVLAGGGEVGSEGYLDKLKKIISDYPIELRISPTFKELQDLYGKAKVFWSAAGYGVNEDNDPIKLEHFGMTVVESMAAGDVPIIYNAGGHKEIIKEGVNGFVWKSEKELINKTVQILSNYKELTRITNTSKKDSKFYSDDNFIKKAIDIVNS